MKTRKVFVMADDNWHSKEFQTLMAKFSILTSELAKLDRINDNLIQKVLMGNCDVDSMKETQKSLKDETRTIDQVIGILDKLISQYKKDNR